MPDETFDAAMRLASQLLEGLGVLIILIGFAVAAARFVVRLRTEGAIRRFRRDLGQAILLGLEVLVAGDIVHTVTIEFTVRGVLLLAVIVLIRTFLSWSLEVELEGRWPWQRGPTA